VEAELRFEGANSEDIALLIGMMHSDDIRAQIRRISELGEMGSGLEIIHVVCELEAEEDKFADILIAWLDSFNKHVKVTIATESKTFELDSLSVHADTKVSGIDPGSEDADLLCVLDEDDAAPDAAPAIEDWDR